MDRRILTWTVAAAWSLAACATPSRPPPPHITSPDELIQQVQKIRTRVHDAESRAAISIQIDGVRQRAQGVIFYRSPDSLRLEVTGPVGTGLLSALFYRDSIDVYLPRENEFLRGRANSVLRSITGMELGYYDVPQALLGLPDLKHEDLAHLTSFSATENTYRLAFASPIGVRRITIDRTVLGLLDDALLDRFGALISRRRVSDYKRYGDLYLPKRISIEQDGNHIHIHHTRTRPNTGIAPHQLPLNVPRTARKKPTPSR